MRWLGLDELEQLSIILVIWAVALIIVERKTFKKYPFLLGALLGGLFGFLVYLLEYFPVLGITFPIWEFLPYYGIRNPIYGILDGILFSFIGALIGLIVSKLRRSK